MRWKQVISETQSTEVDCDLDNLSPVIICIFAQWRPCACVPGTVLGTEVPGDFICLVCCCILSQGIIFMMKDGVDSFLSIN